MFCVGVELIVGYDGKLIVCDHTGMFDKCRRLYKLSNIASEYGKWCVTIEGTRMNDCMSVKSVLHNQSENGVCSVYPRYTCGRTWIHTMTSRVTFDGVEGGIGELFVQKMNTLSLHHKPVRISIGITSGTCHRAESMHNFNRLEKAKKH